MSSTVWPSAFRRCWSPATRSADGPMSTPGRLWPRSIGTPMMRIFRAIYVIRADSPDNGRERVLRVHAIYHPRERNDFTNVLSSANPCHRAFQAQSEACVRNAAVTAKVQIPPERFFREVTFAQPLDEQIVVRDAFTAADDFAVALGSEHVKSKRQLGPQRVRLHVKRLEGRRIAVHHHWTVVRAR